MEEEADRNKPPGTPLACGCWFVVFILLFVIFPLIAGVLLYG